MVNGSTVEIGGRTFKVPRLRLLAYERAVAVLQEIRDKKEADDPFGLLLNDAVARVTAEVLREAHPDLTVEEIKATIYQDEVGTVIPRLLAAAGKREPTPGEGASP
jgi:hypothetical protein